MEERQIICGDAYAFQGDERDVIFLSMVASLGETTEVKETNSKALESTQTNIAKTEDEKAIEQNSFKNIVPSKNTIDTATELQSKQTVAIKERKETPSANEQTSFNFVDELSHSTQVQQDIFGESEAHAYKEMLIENDFNAYINLKEPYKVYVVGTSQLETELSRIAPKSNSFSFLKHGNQDTPGESIWYVDMGTEIKSVFTEPKNKNNNIKEQQITTVNASPLNKVKLKPEKDHLFTLIKEMVTIGLEVIDYRDKSKTLYVIGGKELEQSLSTYQTHGLIFRFLNKGNKTTGFRPSWFAKVTT